jgi:hypothetical protein
MNKDRNGKEDIKEEKKGDQNGSSHKKIEIKCNENLCESNIKHKCRDVEHPRVKDKTSTNNFSKY